VTGAISSLQSNPRPAGCKKLAGNADYYRIRVGDYRVLYEIRDRVLLVLVIKVGHRREVYG
jgi:mRNA interferase RelE/StbE